MTLAFGRRTNSVSYIMAASWSMIFAIMCLLYGPLLAFARGAGSVTDLLLLLGVALSVVINLIFASQSVRLRDDASGPWLLVTVICVVCIALFPGPISIGFTTVLAIQWLLSLGPKSSPAFTAAVTLLLASAHSLWFPLALPFFELFVLPLDVKLVAWLFEIHGDIEELTLTGGHTVTVDVKNSTIGSFSSAVLCWLVLVGLIRGRVARPDVISLIILLISLASVNTFRLGLIAQTPHGFEFWSSGRGGDLIVALKSVLSVSIPLVGVKLFKERLHG